MKKRILFIVLLLTLSCGLENDQENGQGKIQMCEICSNGSECKSGACHSYYLVIASSYGYSSDCNNPVKLCSIPDFEGTCPADGLNIYYDTSLVLCK